MIDTATEAARDVEGDFNAVEDTVNRLSESECLESNVVLFKFEDRDNVPFPHHNKRGEEDTSSSFTSVIDNTRTIVQMDTFSSIKVHDLSQRKVESRSSIVTDKEEDIDDIDMDYEYHMEKARLDLPAMEIVIQNLSIASQRTDPISKNQSREPSTTTIVDNNKHTERNERKYNGLPTVTTFDIDYSLSSQLEMDLYNSSFEQCLEFDEKTVDKACLGAREQEEEDGPVLEALHYMFDNKFLRAKSIIQKKACRDPLYAVSISFMLFMRATLSRNEDDVQITLKSLDTTLAIANTQLKHFSSRHGRGDGWLPSIKATTSKTKQSTLPPILPLPEASDSIQKPKFTPNTVLRSSVIRGECHLMSAILQMTQYHNFYGDKCASYLRKAYRDYTLVWQEYKRMGQKYTQYIDRETVSAVHFGIGSLHLILSCFPHKQAEPFLAAMNFQCDKQLGMALLKLCIEGGGIRSSAAYLVILAYCTFLTAQTPRLYMSDTMRTAVDALTGAQRAYPNSCFLLLHTMRLSRFLQNIRLSSESAKLAINQTHNEWMEGVVSDVGRFEIGQNLALQLDWESAATCFKNLIDGNHCHYSTYIVVRYYEGACYGMLNEHTKSILSFADVSRCLELHKNESNNSKKPTVRMHDINNFIKRRISFFQKNGYQDLEFCLPALELFLIWNAFDQMKIDELNACLLKTETVLTKIYEREKLDYNIRLHQLMPSANLPAYYEHRAVAMLIKASILNAAKRFDESIASINWIMDNKQNLITETWIMPLTYWEAGFTSWGLGNFSKSRQLWETALTFKNYPLERDMSVRLNLALNFCDEKGVTSVPRSKKRVGAVVDSVRELPIVNNKTQKHC